mmetsp:Transcript_3895/g.6491  ORF Transcript_3895/g.6491 Transcript_3895/m.6491 type:complete len:412 (+) Transcript_3895:162-1397(+)|eukprot:CAMPEP_0171491210 /NCGR_PEP_ID=MMETSP0958-20121227/3736_1 /TAXON_ID=87120 /ORGANISM="Aurantiochytrium limacinum, Strain ATCCMYA-1381" /LENGTH=411 /DNA_ID=CAMNT_0012024609 /DNA_START=68 /DNA_END=1303 /DNA_ORIENTATION=-
MAWGFKKEKRAQAATHEEISNSERAAGAEISGIEESNHAALDNDSGDNANEDHVERIIKLADQATTHVVLSEEDLAEVDNDHHATTLNQHGETLSIQKEESQVDNPTEADNEDTEDLEKFRAAHAVIKRGCVRVGVASFATAGIGLGAIASLTLGIAASSGMTQIQYDMISEIGHIYGHNLTPETRERLLQVLSGISRTSTQVTAGAIQAASTRAVGSVAEHAAKHSNLLLRLVPYVGAATAVLATTSINMSTTYLIGRRAQVYFAEGEDALPSFADSARLLTGIDERKIARWLIESFGIFRDRVWEKIRNGPNAAFKAATRRVIAVRSFISKRLSFRKGPVGDSSDVVSEDEDCDKDEKLKRGELHHPTEDDRSYTESDEEKDDYPLNRSERLDANSSNSRAKFKSLNRN